MYVRPFHAETYNRQADALLDDDESNVNAVASKYARTG